MKNSKSSLSNFLETPVNTLFIGFFNVSKTYDFWIFNFHIGTNTNSSKEKLTTIYQYATMLLVICTKFITYGGLINEKGRFDY